MHHIQPSSDITYNDKAQVHKAHGPSEWSYHLMKSKFETKCKISEMHNDLGVCIYQNSFLNRGGEKI